MDWDILGLDAQRMMTDALVDVAYKPVCMIIFASFLLCSINQSRSSINHKLKSHSILGINIIILITIFLKECEYVLFF